MSDTFEGGPGPTAGRDSPSRGGGTGHAITHGGNLDAARRRFPSAPEPWIDLSTGINPVPYPVPLLPLTAWTRLPEAAAQAALIASAAERYRAPDLACVVAAPGTQALIQVLPRLRPQGRVAVLGPTYEEHAASWRRCGHDVAVVASLHDARGADVVVVVNPDNPTGRLIDPERLRSAARALHDDGGLLVVDEAFMDVLPAESSLIRVLPPSAIVLRSFGKTYGLAGLRLGFAIAAPSLAARISAELGPWAIPGPAIEIGRHALADSGWLQDATARLVRDQTRLDAMLRGGGLDIVGGTPLFRLACLPKADRLVERFGAAGIHVRAFPGRPDWVRFGLPGDAEQWTRVAAALCAPVTAG